LYGKEWPEPFLALAWSRMFQNSAHDSICGCSADEVSAQVLVRYAEAEQIGRELSERALRRIAAKVPRGAFAVVNPSPRERTALIELELEAPDEWESVELELPDGSVVPTQEIERQPGFKWERELIGAEVPAAIARRLHGRELFGRIVNGFTIGDGRATLALGEVADPAVLDMDELIETVSVATAEGEWQLRVLARPRRTFVAAVTVPPLGWTSVRPRRGRGTIPKTGPVPSLELRALTRIVRGKDVGDSYNYAPPVDDELVEEPIEERFEELELGPLRRVDVLHRTYVWDDKRIETQTRFEQRVDEPFVRIRIEFDNQCDDQRVRVHVPLNDASDRSQAEGQFGIVERDSNPEGGYGEATIATYPASAWVAAGGIALLLEHVTEYEVTGAELALTILRSTGLISRSDNPWREDPAGPTQPIPTAQLRGPRSFSFAYSPSADQVHDSAERFRHPFVTAVGTAAGDELRSAKGPELEGDASVVLTAYLKDRARLVNESDTMQTIRFAGKKLELRPWEIRTIPL
jgi:alpha-mannosidase